MAEQIAMIRRNSTEHLKTDGTTLNTEYNNKIKLHILEVWRNVHRH